MATDFRGERLDVFAVDVEDFVYHLVRYDFARQRAHGRVLDLACGVGYGSYFLCNSNEIEEVIGADISTKSIEYAVKTFRHDKLSFSIQSATNTTFLNDSVDTFISLETVEHLRNVVAFFAEVKRILRPNGTLIMTVPNKKFFLDAGFNNEFHFNEMYFDSLRSLLTETLGQVDFYYQTLPEERYERLRQEVNKLSIPRKMPVLLRYIPRPVKRIARQIIGNIQYSQTKNKSIPKKYGMDFDRFLADNKQLCGQYAIKPIVDDIYERVAGNFVAVWRRNEAVNLAKAQDNVTGNPSG